MANIYLYPFDVSALNRIADTAYINTFDREYLQELANTIERYVTDTQLGLGKLEEIPGADGEPDYVGPTYKVRPGRLASI